jgi:hypothetical protein
VKTIYDSGPYSIWQKCLAVVGALVFFGLSSAVASISYFVLLAGRFDLAILFGLLFVALMAFLLGLLGATVIWPVICGYSTRIFLNDKSKLLIDNGSPFGFMHVYLDINRTNEVEVVEKRGGKYMVFATYRSDGGRPNFGDLVQIGTYYSYNKAHAIAQAIQSEIKPEQYSALESAQFRAHQMRFMLKLVIGFALLFEFVIAETIYSHWNQLNLLEMLIAAFMATIPLIILRRILRLSSESEKVPLSDQAG